MRRAARLTVAMIAVPTAGLVACSSGSPGGSGPRARATTVSSSTVESVSTSARTSAVTSSAAVTSRPTSRSTAHTSATTTAVPATTTTSSMRFTARGRYVFPVARCSSSYSSSHHDYPASDIFTQKGCPFVAVTAGRVDEVSYVDRWNPSTDAGATRGGRSVSIVGDDGVRYYGSHLERIAAGIRPGVRVRAGQVLGFIDNSGDARYVPTHVHFGISWPTRPGVWWVRRGEVWPQRYLAAWRAGEDLSPAPEVRRVHARMGDVPPCRAEC